MKMTAALLAIFFSSLSMWAQPVINDPLVQKRTVGAFHGIEVATGIHLHLSNGAAAEVAVSASAAEFRDRIVTEVKNGILHIHYDSKAGAINRRKEAKELKAYVAVTSLDELRVITGANVSIQGILKLPALKMQATTGAVVKGEVDLGQLKVHQNTGSVVKLTGKADNLQVEGNTGSQFTGENLVAGTCQAEVSTGAQVLVHADRELEIKASTGGQVRYAGNPQIRGINVNSGGQVKRQPARS